MSTILIVDDQPSAREALSAMLEDQGYLLEMATNGLEALELADRLRPDLILLDVMMPAMDGFEVCRRIRSTPGLAEVPVIILTALDDRPSLMLGIESGADDFLTKPVNRQELVARVRTITRLNRYRTLTEQRENLRKMAERVLVAQEEERKYISRELHDELGQALTTHLLSLRNMQEEVSAPEETLFERLQTLYEQANEMLSSVRRLTQDLRPPVLDTLGLGPAMQSYCAEFSRRTSMPVAFEMDQQLPVLPDIYNITFYRALQESLTNIAKHAQASQVWVELNVEEDLVSLTVQDNGCGFDEGREQTQGFGLTGLRERLTIAGGDISIRSSPKRGTILSARLPLPEEHTARVSV